MAHTTALHKPSNSCMICAVLAYHTLGIDLLNCISTNDNNIITMLSFMFVPYLANFASLCVKIIREKILKLYFDNEFIFIFFLFFFTARQNNYKVESNQELIALGKYCILNENISGEHI